NDPAKEAAQLDPMLVISAAAPPSGAVLHYYLKADSDPVTLDILDSTGSDIRHYTSAQRVQQQDPKTMTVAAVFAQAPPILSAVAGSHEWSWDLRVVKPGANRGGGRGGRGGGGGGRGGAAGHGSDPGAAGAGSADPGPSGPGRACPKPSRGAADRAHRRPIARKRQSRGCDLNLQRPGAWDRGLCRRITQSRCLRRGRCHAGTDQPHRSQRNSR